MTRNFEHEWPLFVRGVRWLAGSPCTEQSTRAALPPIAQEPNRFDEAYRQFIECAGPLKHRP
jgi:hypothetical protein